MWDKGFYDTPWRDAICDIRAKILRFGKMQYAIDEYSERFYDTPDNFESVRVPPLWIGDPVNKREFLERKGHRKMNPMEYFKILMK